MKKRKDYISWDEYFMGVAVLSSMRSKDPNTQVGACIVNAEQRIVGVGYNGLPIGVDDDEVSWDREGCCWLETKYPYVCHAELNAILNATVSLKGCRMYVGLFPCNECAKAIIQAGIREVIFLSDKYAQEDTTVASKWLFDQSGVSYRQLIPSHTTITLELS